MEVRLRTRFEKPPRLSFILLDWSCRESYHFLDYLERQSVDRSHYEIIWIEYFDRRVPELDRRIERARAEGRRLPVDTYVVMDIHRDVYYHKHLMYNLGIVLSQGELICICDSDAMARPSFVASILDEFDRDPEIALHHDEVRSLDQRFYPFNYPSFEEVTRNKCINWTRGKTTGLWDTIDPLHSRNYGSCMSARREDAIAIGGADEHIDYLGHICGPYDLTFRLVNHGRREVWHLNEWLYHVWHPGQAGENNFCGPHDGRHMSLPALEARASGRVAPLLENRAIARLRQELEARSAGEAPARATSEEELLGLVLDPVRMSLWRFDTAKVSTRTYDIGGRVIQVHERVTEGTAGAPGGSSSADPAALDAAGSEAILATLGPIPSGYELRRSTKLRLASMIAGVVIRNFAKKIRTVSKNPVDRKLEKFSVAFVKIPAASRYLFRSVRELKFFLERTWQSLARMSSRGKKRIYLYGEPDLARMVCRLARDVPTDVIGVATPESSPRLGRDLKAVTGEELASGNEPVLVASRDPFEATGRLERMGVKRRRIVALN